MVMAGGAECRGALAPVTLEARGREVEGDRRGLVVSGGRISITSGVVLFRDVITFLFLLFRIAFLRQISIGFVFDECGPDASVGIVGG